MSDVPVILAVVGVVWNSNTQIGWQLSLHVAFLSQTPNSTVPIENEYIYGVQRVLQEQFEELNYSEEEVNRS